MSLLRRCRVNAALTIQLFSWLFHHVNMWLFNSLVGGPPGSCTRHTGALLKRRLLHLVAWAEKQGLELAADCHLSRIIQVGDLRSRRLDYGCYHLMRSRCCSVLIYLAMLAVTTI